MGLLRPASTLIEIPILNPLSGFPKATPDVFNVWRNAPPQKTAQVKDEGEARLPF